MKIGPISARKNFEIRGAERPLVNLRAKRAQDKKPCRVMAKPLSGPFQSTYGLRSHSSLRRRHGMKVSATRLSLPTLSSAPHIRVQPFGLPSRFDVAHPVAQSPLPSPLAPHVSNQAARVGRRYHIFSTATSIYHPHQGEMESGMGRG